MTLFVRLNNLRLQYQLFNFGQIYEVFPAKSDQNFNFGR